MHYGTKELVLVFPDFFFGSSIICGVVCNFSLLKVLMGTLKNMLFKFVLTWAPSLVFPRSVVPCRVETVLIKAPAGEGPDSQ